MKMTLSSRSAGIIMLIIICQALQAQPWSPLKLNEKFNYSLNSVNFITNTIWTDSVKTAGGDSVFYLNRIVTGCDSCQAPYKWANKPDFLKTTMVRKPGGIYNFRTPGSMVIRTLAKTGDTWLYDTTRNIQAQLVSAVAEPVFGITDSVKEILLSDGYSIRLSKNFGLLRFPSSVSGSSLYSLEGIEGRNVGQLVPRFKEIYNYNTGDIFQYHNRYFSYGIQQGIEYLTKIKIISKDSSSGHYAYNILRISCSWPISLIGSHGDTTHYYEFDTLVFSDSIHHPANYYPNQMIENPLNIDSPNTGYFQTTPDVNQVYTKWVGAMSPGDDPAVYIHGTYCTPPLPWDVLVPGGFVTTFLKVFKPGLGNTYYAFSFFEVEELEELIGYIKNGEATGIIYPDDFILEGLHNSIANQEFIVYPNPAGDFLFIRNFIPVMEAAAEIRNLSGVIVKKVPFEFPIDVSDLSPGYYFISIITRKNEKTWNGNFLKK